jgi:hypothetical protein
VDVIEQRLRLERFHRRRQSIHEAIKHVSKRRAERRAVARAHRFGRQHQGQGLALREVEGHGTRRPFRRREGILLLASTAGLRQWHPRLLQLPDEPPSLTHRGNGQMLGDLPIGQRVPVSKQIQQIGATR